MLLAITLALAAIVVLLIVYAAYLRLKLLTGKGRFAASIVGAIMLAVPTTIFAVGQLNFLESLTSNVLTLMGRSSLIGPWSVASKALDYFLIIVLCLVLIRTLYRFGQSTIETWDGPPTSLDAQLIASGTEMELFQIAREYLAMRATGKADVVIDERALHSSLELSDAPPNPHWDLFARDLILEAINEISVAETAWSTELNCWFGTLAPVHDPSKTTTVAVLPVSQELTSKQAVTLLHDRKGQYGHLYVCVDSDDRLDKVFDHDGVKVRIISKASLLSLGVNLRGYCEDLISRFERDSVLGTALTLSDIFVEPTLVQKEDGATTTFSALIDDWVAKEGRQQLSLVGEFGQGKSSAILQYCADWAKSYIANPQINRRIPLLIPLRGRDPSTLTRSNFLAAWGAQHRLSGRALLNLVVAGRAILFFEGFDEVNNAGLRSQRLAQFDALWRFAFPRSKIAFTGRPNFFLDDKELRRLLRIDEIMAASGQPFATLYSFRFFDEQKIEEALRPFPQSTSDGILAHYRTDARFRDIASRPSMLPLIAITWDEIKESLVNSGKVTSAKIIENYIEFEYRRKEREVEDEQIKSGLTKKQNYLHVPHRVKNFYMMAIARDMQRAGMSNTISRDDLEKSIRAAQLVSEAYVAHIDASDEEIQYTKDYLTQEREQGAGKTQESLISDIRTTGVVVRDVVSGPAGYYFPHKQFYEYFIALFCYWSVQQKLSGEDRGPYWTYFSMSNPCLPLLREPEARKFFVEMSDQRWYDAIFTVDNVNLAKSYTILAASAIAWAKINARLVGADKIFDAIDSIRLPKLPRYTLSLILPAAILTVIVMIFMHFPTLVAIVFGVATLAIVIGIRIAVRGHSLLALLQWYELTKLRHPGDAESRAKRVLGPVTYKAAKSIDDFISERREAAELRASERVLSRGG
ncbi:hypothetical protein [Devosia sp. Root105]|uniref:NACHT domain-containing protein n=1 Tax=Devosia sp. Root105 TaxID=1736423 RepID=UPI0006F3070F|nr:hypothetical protein [Devosia sp. Root105]KQU97450.1 hypothetical protein ASC68_11630 [Devosia sp. Root105]